MHVTMELMGSRVGCRRVWIAQVVSTRTTLAQANALIVLQVMLNPHWGGRPASNAAWAFPFRILLKRNVIRAKLGNLRTLWVYPRVQIVLLGKHKQEVVRALVLNAVQDTLRTLQVSLSANLVREVGMRM
jgi:hypothetical protein